MKKLKKISIFSVSILLIGLFGLTGHLYAEVNLELQRSSIVITSTPEFKFHAKQSFAWAKNYADVSGALKKSEFSVQQLIDTAIAQTLKNKGLNLVAPAENSFLIKYHVSLESEMDDTALAINYGLAPGLRANSSATKKHPRGTLVVDFIDPKLNKVVWRGAIGVFTGLENTQQARQQRVNMLLNELLKSVPANY